MYTRFTRIVLTEEGRLYRWLTQEDDGYLEMEFPERKEQSIGAALLNVGVIPTKSKEKSITVRQVYADQLGHHTFLAAEGGTTFYLHSKDPKLRHVGKLQGVAVKSLIFVS